MRLIDADKLQPDRFTGKHGFSVSCDQIAEAKTIDAIPKQDAISKDEMLSYVEESIEANKKALRDPRWKLSDDYLNGIIYAYECMKKKLI